MSYRSTHIAVLCLALMIPCCGKRTPHSDKFEYDSALAEAVELFTKFHLPNSMTLEPGLDINRHLANIEQRRRKITKVFHTRAGATYLAHRVDRESDEMAILAILQILYESGQPAAFGVFQEYAHHSSPVVSEWSGEYLLTFKISKRVARDG